MRSRNVIYSLVVLLALLALAINVWRHEYKTKEAFDRTPARLIYTKHALCRMDCRQIDKNEIQQVISSGVIMLNKSNRNDKPCPTFALQGLTKSGENIRVILAQCDDITKVITCYNLKKEFACDCPGDEKKR